MGHEKEFTDSEKIYLYQRTIEKLSIQVADFSANLSIAQAQIDMMKEQQEQKNAEK